MPPPTTATRRGARIRPAAVVRPRRRERIEPLPPSSAHGAAGDAGSGERAEFEPFLGNRRAALRAHAVGAGVDAGECRIDLLDRLLEIGAAALGDRVRNGLRALGERLLALAH